MPACRKLLPYASLLAALSLVAAAASPQDDGPRPPAGAQPPAGRQEPSSRPESGREPCVRPLFLEASIHELRLAAGGIEQLSQEAVLAAHATSTSDLSAALARFGETRLLYLIQQEIDLGMGPESLEVTVDNPYLFGHMQGPEGRRVPQVGRERLGVELHLSGGRLWTSKDPISAVRLRVELRTTTPSDVRTGEDTFASVTRQLECGGLVVPPRPSVFVLADASTGQTGAAYVLRVAIRPLGQDAAAAPHAEVPAPIVSGQ